MSVDIKGQIEVITFHNPENGYTIARLLPEGQEERVTVVGTILDPRQGDGISIEGEWINHKLYGRQLKINTYTQVKPSTLEGIRKYLGSGLIRGIGPVFADRIVEHFGPETLDVIDTQPKRLLEVPNLGKKRVEKITTAWEEQRHMKDVMLFLQSNGVTTGYATRIFKKYGTRTIALVQENPYRLERDIAGIGFQIADGIAQKTGIAKNAPQRIRAGIRYLLEQAAEQGHVFLQQEELIHRCADILEIGAELIPPELGCLEAEDGVIHERQRYYLPPLYRAEEGVTRAIRLLCSATTKKIPLPPRAATLDGLQLSKGQQEAIDLARREKVLVLTGGPGTGKTTLTRELLGVFEQARLRVVLCSPTGRAAKRLSAATGREAKTIHRLLEFSASERGFKKGINDKLAADAVIVDETSMIDLMLMNALLRAVPNTARLVLIGDVDQLPSVGPGNVLRDIIESTTVPVVRLQEIFRQASESSIVVNAHLINSGESPDLNNAEDSDFFFVQEDRPEHVADAIEDLCARRLPAHKGYDPKRDIQVLTPMYRGETGADNLNQRLQQRLNPGGEGCAQGGYELRRGDKVMQVRNNYDKGVFNGDSGILRRIDVEEQEVEVEFDQLVRYELTDLHQLRLAYAISIHRAQGSEFKAVVLPLSTQHFVMLQRNLLYTAVTRAKEIIVIVGSRKALNLTISNDAVAARNTTLAERLRTLDMANPI
jgi:exodeoxyribonuclease V alpha subunit